MPPILKRPISTQQRARWRRVKEIVVTRYRRRTPVFDFTSIAGFSVQRDRRANGKINIPWLLAESCRYRYDVLRR